MSELNEQQVSVLRQEISARFVQAFAGFGVRLPENEDFTVKVPFGTTWESICAKQKDTDEDGKFHRFCPVEVTLISDKAKKYPSSLYCGNVRLEDGDKHELEQLFEDFADNLDLLYGTTFTGRTSDIIVKQAKSGDSTYEVTYLSLTGVQG